MSSNIGPKKQSVSRRTFAKSALIGATSLYMAGRLRGSAITHEESPSRFVNPLIGASTSSLFGEGKTFPGPTTPFGMVQLSPDTITGGMKGPDTSMRVIVRPVIRMSSGQSKVLVSLT
jgi:putative alpha-1,2-mannosidase